ncbi:uncharacterized protein LOC123440074 [Hordeum vulgare subsp. vulgare]|uniref:Predicted protein n=1 Tax=Hordeum vulgare subsp. vulgare TaxID=112509 RepID=F2DI80_HORVV|nr:uncharacterized protein LOC123440074 [Hordeum vulgare subsp. vulgare]BAJ94801.1 predicted protein [Hordeum vulgare subsp. vulgare]
MAMMGIVKADIAPETAYETEPMSPAATSSAAGARHRRGLLRRMMTRGHYSPVGAEHGRAPAAAPIAAHGSEVAEKPRRGWLRRLIPQDGVLQRRRWKNLGGASASRLAGLSRSLRWKRLSVNLRGSWASALLDTVAFRVMYVVEAIVLGLALSCFFCCCGCQI